MQHQAVNDLTTCAACLELSEPRYREAARLYRAIGNHPVDANAGERGEEPIPCSNRTMTVN